MIPGETVLRAVASSYSDLRKRLGSSQPGGHGERSRLLGYGGAGQRGTAKFEHSEALFEKVPPVGFEPTHTAPEARLLFRDANTDKCR